jgi:hypothetical protein
MMQSIRQPPALQAHRSPLNLLTPMRPLHHYWSLRWQELQTGVGIVHA